VSPLIYARGYFLLALINIKTPSETIPVTMKPEDAMQYAVKDRVAILTINFPPVNALGAPMREGMVIRLKQAMDDAGVDAIVLIGANDRFIAGADIREIGQPRRGPTLHEIQAMMEGSSKPVVAAIDGHALGGGLETAFAAHYRVAIRRAKLGLPEVNLGLLPGAGGTQRLTRLAGPEVALDLILSGRHISADEALALGIVDEVCDRDLADAAVRFIRAKAAQGGPWPVLLQKKDKVNNADPALFEACRKQNARKWKGTVAPFQIVDCIEAATKLSPEEGVKFEEKAFYVCSDAPSRAAQVHLFFSERTAAKVNGVDKSIKPQSIRSAGVVGAGTMGGGIAMSLVNAGIDVVLLDVNDDALSAGMSKVRANYQMSVSRGSRSQEEVDAAMAKIKLTSQYSDFAGVDLVIEAVFENMEAKQKVFQQLDTVVKPGALLASNTSALDIDGIAGATKRPGDVVGMHFFSPANVMKLVEVIRGDLASDQAVVTAMNLAKEIGKVPVLAGNCDGFIGNRILARYGQEADLLLLEGATPWQIDGVLKEFGFPMGLYLMRDMSGLDVGWRMRANRIAEGKLDITAEEYMPLADRLCEANRFGQKTGAGYYVYDGRNASPDPAVEKMLHDVAAEKGVVRKAISDEEILNRIVIAIVNEGADILQEGIAQRASDIDIVYTSGYGFPKYRGGPMFWAEQQGLSRVLEKMQQYQSLYGKRWEPSKLLVERATAGNSWND
jgi:3-hydroxyacyl-CoA dehydrogenase